MNKPDFKNLFKILIVLSVLCGTACLFFHHYHAIGDKHHHEDACELCINYQSFSNGITHTPAITVAILLVVVATLVKFHTSQIFISLNLLLVHPGLDPPVITFN